MRLFEEIGGYFELEGENGGGYHKDAIALNTGRNAFEYIVRINNCKKIYIPYFTCDVLLEPLIRLKVDYEFYSIDEELEIVKLDSLDQDIFLLYTNYFGLKSSYADSLIRSRKKIIIDSCLSFFYEPVLKTEIFYSPRKYFGVPDGGYAISNTSQVVDIEKDHSLNRFSHLLTRVEYGAEKGYEDFKMNENRLSNMPILKMSDLSCRLLNGIEYKKVIKRRNENFNFLHARLGESNKFAWIEENTVCGPMHYPYYSDQLDLREKLIRKKIFVPTYWPNVTQWSPENSFEQKLKENLLPLPIDQRYSIEDMSKIVDVIYE
jgi:hypothetical protein